MFTTSTEIPMKLRCAILDDYQDIALTIVDWSTVLDRVDIDTFQTHFKSEEEVVTQLKDYDMIVIMRERTPFPDSVFRQLPKLRLLITTGMRNASIDVSSAERHGVLVCGTESKSNPPSELTWALILGLSKHLVEENHAFRSKGSWQSTIGVDLQGKTLGLLGLGKIGTKVGHIGSAFGMNVLAWSQNLTAEKAAENGARLASSKEQLLEQSDVVSIHLVLSDRTRHLIRAEDFQRMKSSAYLINTSRAGIVDQEALIGALTSRTIAGAGVDVFEQEPLPEDHIFRSLPNLLATPHLGYVTHDNYKTYFTHVVEDIEQFLNGEPIRQLNGK